MADFLDDSEGLLSGLGAGIKGAIQGYHEGQDRSMKQEMWKQSLDDKKYNRQLMAAKLKAMGTEEQRKRDQQDIEQLKAGGFVTPRDQATGLYQRKEDGTLDTQIKPELIPPPKPLHPIMEQYYNEQTRALGTKPIIEQQKEIAQMKAKGFNPVYDHDKPTQINDWAETDEHKSSRLQEEAKINAEIGLKNAKTKKAGLVGTGGPDSKTMYKWASELQKDLDPNGPRGGNMGKSQAMINSAQRVEGLFHQFPDYNVPKAQTVELTSAIAGLINGGSAQSQHQIDAMTPSSMAGNANAIAGWLTNDPRGSGQQKFMKMLHETAVREREIAMGQVKDSQLQRLGRHQQFKSANPGQYEAILKQYHLDPNEVDENGLYKKGGGLINGGLVQPGLVQGKQGAAPGPAPTPHPQDNAAVSWAKSNLNGPNAEKAKAILKANGL